MLSVLYIVFTHVIRTETQYYVLYLLLGLIMWNMFSRATSMSLNSILSRGRIITQVYFPMEILPLSSCITSFIMMIFEFAVFFAFVIALKFMPPLSITFLLFLSFLEFVLTLGLSLPLAVLNVYYRDIQYIWGLLLYVGFFITPIFYRLDIFPPNIQQLLYFNPMAQIIDMAHNAALYNTLPTLPNLAYTVTVSFAILVAGYFIFRFYERRVVEEL